MFLFGAGSSSEGSHFNSATSVTVVSIPRRSVGAPGGPGVPRPYVTTAIGPTLPAASAGRPMRARHLVHGVATAIGIVLLVFGPVVVAPALTVAPAWASGYCT